MFFPEDLMVQQMKRNTWCMLTSVGTSVRLRQVLCLSTLCLPRVYF